MVGVNQVFSLADNVANHIRVCGKRSILEIKPLQGRINIEGLRLSPRAIHDTVNLTLKNFEQALKELSSQIFEKIYGVKPRSQENLTILMNNLRSNSNSNLEIVSRRYNKLLEKENYLSRFLMHKEVKDVDFFINNLDEIANFKYENNGIGADINTLLQILDKESFTLLKSCKNSTEIEKVAQQIIYDSKPHNIKLGNRTAEVDLSDVIAIVSGKQASSYFKTGSSKNFENTVLKLTEINNPKVGQQYYYQIAEGILEQRPDLIKIVDELNQAIKTSNLPESEILENFFIKKFQMNELPKTINLKTIIPDENALILPENTFNIFKSRLQKRSS